MPYDRIIVIKKKNKRKRGTVQITKYKSVENEQKRKAQGCLTKYKIEFEGFISQVHQLVPMNIVP